MGDGAAWCQDNGLLQTTRIPTTDYRTYSPEQKFMKTVFIVQPELETRGTTSRHVQSLTLLSQPRSRVWCIVLGERHRLPGVHEC